ncbi:hypothetical protein, partial [Herbaspirillum robiniae]|uniref:hypothetical protein n=1 Tax=Herbaspirillum robiniae TaxID=2014887 RepID=UPI001C2FA177
CHEQDCGLNMGQLRMQISGESGSVFDATQHLNAQFEGDDNSNFRNEKSRLKVGFFLESGGKCKV